MENFRFRQVYVRGQVPIQNTMIKVNAKLCGNQGHENEAQEQKQIEGSPNPVLVGTFHYCPERLHPGFSAYLAGGLIVTLGLLMLRSCDGMASCYPEDRECEEILPVEAAMDKEESSTTDVAMGVERPD